MIWVALLIGFGLGVLVGVYFGVSFESEAEEKRQRVARRYR